MTSSRRRRCYVASPLGFTEAGRDYYYRIFLPALDAVVTPLDPWALTSPDEIAAARADGSLAELALEIGRRNASAIRGAELLVALLDGQEADSGTAAEVGYAAALGLRCYGLRTDFRAAGDLGMTVNLQLESFIRESGGHIAGSLDALVDALRT